MKKTILLFLLGFFFVANSQQLSGTIINNENKPIENAEVYIESLQLQTVSDAEGNFEFNNLPKAVLKIKIDMLGYKTLNKEVDLKTTDTLEVTLETAIFNMDEVIVSTPFNKLQSENVMKVEKTTLKQLRESGAITLAESLGQTPGIEVVSSGVGIAKPVIRGLRGNRIIVYNAGVRLENQQWGEEHGLGVDETGVESYEVIKGPASLLFGSDALGGVIYFNPEKFAGNDEFKASARTTYFSNTNGYKAKFGAKKSINGWKFIANATRSEHSDYETGDGTSVTNSRFNETNFNTAIGFNNKFIATTFRYLHSSSELGIPEEIGDQTNTKSLEEPFQDLSSNLLSITNTFFLKNSKIAANFGFNNNVRKEFEEHHHDEEEEEEEEHEEHEEAALELALNTYNYDVKWHLLKKNNLEAIIGVQGMYQTNQNNGEEILIPDANTHDIGLMTTAFYTQGDHSFQGGIRFDHRNLDTEYHMVEHEGETHEFNPINEDFSNVSASLGYKTKFFKNLNTRINLASGFKAPTLNELASNGEHHGSNRFEIGNRNLKSERSFQADLGLEYSNDYIELIANGFYNNIADFIFASPNGDLEDGLQVVEYLQENAMLYGGEFGIHFHPKEIDWLHVHSNFQAVVGEQENGDYLPFIPASKLTSTVRANLPKGLKSLNNGFASLTFENNFDQENVSPFENRTGGFSLLNFGLGGNITFDKVDLDFNFNINNLLDEFYVNHLSRLKINNIQNIGRNFVFGVRASI